MTIKPLEVPKDWYDPKASCLPYKARYQYAHHIGDELSAKIHTWIERYTQIKNLIQCIVTEVKQANRDKSSIQIKIEKNPIKLDLVEKQFVCECLNVKHRIKVLQIDETNPSSTSFQVISNPKIQSIEELLFSKWKNSIDTDFIFLVNDNEFPCHRLILEAKSRIFNPSSLQETQSGIYLIDDPTILPATFKTFLEFIYTQKISKIEDLNVKNLIGLLSLSHRFQIEELQDQIIVPLKNQINEQTVEPILQASQLHNIPILSKSCYRFLMEIHSSENHSAINGLLQRFGFEPLKEVCKNQFLHQMLNQPTEFLKTVQKEQEKKRLLLAHVQWVKEHQDEYIAILIRFFKDKESLPAFCNTFKEIFNDCKETYRAIESDEEEEIDSDEEEELFKPLNEKLNCTEIVSLWPFFTMGSLQSLKKEYLDPDLQDKLLLQYGEDFISEWKDLLQDEAFEHKLCVAREKDFTKEDQNFLSKQLDSAISELTNEDSDKD